MARQIAVEAIRNTHLETLHSKYFGDKDMRKLMLEIENNLRISLWYWFRHYKNQKIMCTVEKIFFGPKGVSWDIPNREYKKRQSKT